MYESPAYWELKKQIQHWETVRRFVDLARTFRSMAYGGDLTISSEPSQHGSGGHEVTLRDSMRTDALEYLASQCEVLALKINTSKPKDVDVSEACKV